MKSAQILRKGKPDLISCGKLGPIPFSVNVFRYF